MDITRLIDHPELMNKETLFELRRLTALYPYYQTARLLMLRNLYLLHDSSFDEELRRAAIYIGDRKAIFDLVEAAHYNLSPNATQAEEATTTARTDRTIDLINNFLDSPSADRQAQEPVQPHRKPTPADATIDYAAYLLSLDDSPEQPADESAPKLNGQSLIDNFLEGAGGRMQLKENPEYKPQLPDTSDAAKDEEEGYFTETLANIYIKQGRYSKALEIIQRLYLNYPKKNVYFADQIRFLQKLILNNNTTDKK